MIRTRATVRMPPSHREESLATRVHQENVHQFQKISLALSGIEPRAYLVDVLQSQHVRVVERLHGCDFSPQLLRGPGAHVVLVHDLDSHGLARAHIDSKFHPDQIGFASTN